MTGITQRICFLVITLLLFIPTEGYSEEEDPIITFRYGAIENIDLLWKARALLAKQYLFKSSKQHNTEEDAFRTSLEHAYLNFDVTAESSEQDFEGLRGKTRRYTMFIDLPGGNDMMAISFHYTILADKSGVLMSITFYKTPINIDIQIINSEDEHIYSIYLDNREVYNFKENHPLDIRVKWQEQ